jgi:predicted PurR-regulated permease PerM
MAFQTTNSYQKIVPFIIFMLALLLLFNLIKPMILILLSSILFAYVSFPMYKRVSKKIHNKSLAVFLSLFIVLLLISIPFIFLAFGVTQQGYYFYHSITDGIDKGALFGFSCNDADSQICTLLNKAERYSANHLSDFGLDSELKGLIPILEDKLTHFILGIPLLVGKIFITLVISFFILYDGKEILKQITELIPMRKKTIAKLIKRFGDITHTVVYAQLFVALVQGIVATIGFYVFGIPFPLLLGLITAFFALIPAIGTAMIWIPASLFLGLSGYASGNYWLVWKGIGLFLYGVLIVSTIDNLLLAKIVKAKAKVNQIVVIIGVIGGASMFGIMGIFIGPILLPLLLTYFETFKERFN